jgi:hypothetical protein
VILSFYLRATIANVLLLSGWASWNVSRNFLKTRQDNKRTDEHHTDWELAGRFPLYAVRVAASEDGHAYLKGQILEYG